MSDDYNAGIEAAAKWHFSQVLSLVLPDASQVSMDDIRESEFHLKAGRAIRALKREGQP